MIRRALRKCGMFDRDKYADVAGRRIHSAEKRHCENEADLLESREGQAGTDHQGRTRDQ